MFESLEGDSHLITEHNRPEGLMRQEAQMGLAEDFQEFITPKPQPCMLGQWMGSLSPADLDAAETVLSSGLAAPKAVLLFRKYGFAGEATVVRKHRRGECNCVSRG
ncbi:hypothetical protein [Gryllotalpicola koreensis]|uniref:Uncharacterized protein n=1 Tax=Gryllotalpicola koreensis TaxID=993086 RepID=A0ABP8A1S9_9MICO